MTNRIAMVESCIDLRTYRHRERRYLVILAESLAGVGVGVGVGYLEISNMTVNKIGAYQNCW